MKTLINTIALAVALFTLNTAHAEATAEPRKIRVLIVTGGHGFEAEPFFAIFKSFDDITYQAVEHPKAHQLFKPDAATQYDVIVFYDLWQNITDEAKTDFLNLLKQSKGVVFLHHSLGGYQDWPEYKKIIGGKFYLGKRTEDGVEHVPSTWKDGVHYTVAVADPNNPVTRGLKDFEIVDETYGRCEVRPDVTTLLTTDESTNNKQLAWAHTYEKSRVVYVQLGHSTSAYENPNYRLLVHQAIRWTAGKD